jgi:MFS family permease
MIERLSAPMTAIETRSSEHQEATEAPAGRWGALAVLAGANFLAMSTWFSASAVLPQLRAAWSLSSGAAALMTISVQLGFVAGGILSAVLNLADRIPPRRLMLVGAVVAASANAALLESSGGAAAVAMRFLTGAALVLVYPPSLKAMSTWFRRGRGMALGVMVGALTLGSALPHLINALGHARWQMVLAATSALTLAGGLAAEFIGRDGPFPFPRSAFDPAQIVHVFRNRAVRLTTFGYLGHMWELYAMWSWCAAFLADALAAHAAGAATAQREASLGAFAAIGIGAFGCAAGGALGDRWGRTRTTIASLAASGTCALVIGWRGAPVWLVLALACVWGFAVVADSAQFSTIVTEVADPTHVGTALTLQLATGFTLTAGTIWLVSAVRDAYGWQLAFALLALGPVAGIAAMLRLLRSPESARIAGGRG